MCNHFLSSQYQKTIDDDIDIVWRCTQVFPARIIIINSRAEPGQTESLRTKHIVWGKNYNMRSTLHNLKFSLRIRVAHPPCKCMPGKLEVNSDLAGK